LNKEIELDEPPNLARCDAAAEFIEQLKDPIVRNLLNIAFTRVVKIYTAKKTRPIGPFDMMFFVQTLADLFSDGDIIQRTVAGERVGGWFDEEPSKD